MTYYEREGLLMNEYVFTCIVNLLIILIVIATAKIIYDLGKESGFNEGYQTGIKKFNSIRITENKKEERRNWMDKESVI